MADYYYVKDTGSHTGATPFTGSPETNQAFSAFTTSTELYGSIEAAISAGAGSGDYILVSDAHSYDDTADLVYSGPTTGDSLKIWCTDDANCNQEATNTTAYNERTGSGSGEDLYPNGRIHFRGLYFYIRDNFQPTSEGSWVTMENCYIETDDWAYTCTQDNSYLFAKNCTFDCTQVDFFEIAAACEIHMVECDFVKTTGTNDLIAGGGGIGGITATFIDCDLSDITGYLVSGVGQSTADDKINIHFEGCQLASSYSGFVSETQIGQNKRISVVRCAGASASSVEYQYYVTAHGGIVEDIDTIYVNDSTDFTQSAAEVSLRVDTDSNATPSSPFWFDFPVRYCELSGTSEDTLTFNLTCASTLNKGDVWVEVTYQDNTNKHQFTTDTTRPTDLLATDTALDSTSPVTWTGGLTNKYRIVVSTSGGADCYPIVRMYVATETLFYVDTEIRVS